MSDTRQAYNEVIRTSFFHFLWQVFCHLHPGGGVAFHRGAYLETLCHLLEQVMAGNKRNVIANIPPRHLKSITVSVAFPAFVLGHRPSAKFLVASYGDKLAENHARDFNAVMGSQFYRSAFPRTTIKSLQKFDLVTTHGGRRTAVSVGGAVTGLGADFIIIDDLSKAGDMNSAVERQNIRTFYDEVLYSRLNDKSTGSVIAIMQRLHEDDLVAYLSEKGSFEHLVLRAIAEEDERFALSGGRIWTRKMGEALCPEHENLDTLAEIRKQIGPLAFAAQYQQNPTVPGGNRLKWGLFETYGPEFDTSRARFQRVVQSWDTAFSGLPTSDYSVCMTWGYTEDKWYLLDILRQRLEYPRLENAALRLSQRWNPDDIIIEDMASGPSLIQSLTIRHRLGRKVQGLKPANDKIMRLEAQIAKLEEGIFHVPAEAPWLAAFKAECLAFPGKYDDQVDALSQFLYWTGTRRGHRATSPPPGPAPQPRTRRLWHHRNLLN